MLRDRRLTIVLSLAFSLVSPVVGCGGSGGECPQVDGKWTVTESCDQAAVGMAATITQSKCTFHASNGTAGQMDGTLAPDGSFTASGTCGPSNCSCTGSFSGNQMQEDCLVGPSKQACHIVATR
jgi:hypothetical protein